MDLEESLPVRAAKFLDTTSKLLVNLDIGTGSPGIADVPAVRYSQFRPPFLLVGG